MFLLKVIPTDFASQKVRIIVVVILKRAADNKKCLVRIDWKMGFIYWKESKDKKAEKRYRVFGIYLGC